MLFSPLLMQLLMGISMRRYCPATGMAGLLRALVSGNNRVPRPPPRIRHNADDVMGEPLNPFETYRLRVGDTLPSRRKDCKQTADRIRGGGLRWLPVVVPCVSPSQRHSVLVAERPIDARPALQGRHPDMGDPRRVATPETERRDAD